MHALRFPVAFVAAFCGTGCLFWFLYVLISQTVAGEGLKPAQKIEFSRLRRDTETRSKPTQKVQRERPAQALMTPTVTRVTFDGGGEKVEVQRPTVDIKGSISKLTVNGVGSDRDVIPLVRIEPEYPQRAAQRGTEGYVVVQFTITPAGTIQDPKVVDADPKGIFDQAAIKAVSRWKYNPKIEEGVPVERRGVQIKLTFKLEK